MNKTQVYLFAPNFVKGIGTIKSAYLPYAVGSVWSHAITNPRVAENFNLAKLGFLRESIDEIVNSIVEPAICGFSTYIWNEQYNQALAQAIKKRHPNALIFFGGPNVPNDQPVYEKWRKERPWIDVTVRFEGEQSFQLMLLDYLDNDLRKDYISPRIDNLEIPSPYLTGVFDSFIENENIKWSMILETNRGCPFQCTFCDWGGLTYSKIKKFPMQRVLDEITWAGKNKVEYIICADANFGVFAQRDSDISDHLIAVNKEHGYPKLFVATWFKNSNALIIDIAKKLKEGNMSRGITLSVQSMNADTLEAIKRQNMKINDLAEMYRECSKNNIPFYTELILGLPLETLESWKTGHFKLLEMGLHDSIFVFPVEILRNSELTLDTKKYGIRSAVISDYWKCDVTDICESQEIIVETNTMSTQDLIDATMVSWTLITFHHYGWTQIYSRYLNRVHGKEYKEIYSHLFEWLKNHKWLSTELNKAHNNVEKLYKKYESIEYYSIWNTVVDLFKDNDKSHEALAEWFREFYQGPDQDRVIELQKNFIVDHNCHDTRVYDQPDNLLSVILGYNTELKSDPKTYQLTPRGDQWNTLDEFLTFVVLRNREGFGKYYAEDITDSV